MSKQLLRLIERAERNFTDALTAADKAGGWTAGTTRWYQAHEKRDRHEAVALKAFADLRAAILKAEGDGEARATPPAEPQGEE